MNHLYVRWQFKVPRSPDLGVGPFHTVWSVESLTDFMKNVTWDALAMWHVEIVSSREEGLARMGERNVQLPLFRELA